MRKELGKICDELLAQLRLDCCFCYFDIRVENPVESVLWSYICMMDILLTNYLILLYL